MGARLITASIGLWCCSQALAAPGDGLRDGAVVHALPRARVEASGLDLKALAALLAEADRQRSSAVVIVKDGKLVVEKYAEGFDGGPTVAMSVSKSIISLAAGLLADAGKLALDTKAATFFPEWQGGPKEEITVRQLLSHTSGLDPTRADFTRQTIRDRAAKTGLVFKPGSRFQYNNNAVDLAGALLERAAGQKLDAFLGAALWARLDAVGPTWFKDKDGTPMGAGELALRPVDLAKVGQLMLQGGVWNGAPLVSKEWVLASVGSAQPYLEDCGTLWWREGSFAFSIEPFVLEGWRDAKVAPEIIEGARPLLGKKLAWDELLAAMKKALGPALYAQFDTAMLKADHVPRYATRAVGPVWGYSARGWLGQYLVVIPEAKLVGVRMRAPEKADYVDQEAEKNAYRSFARDLRALVPKR